jgi:hypothetical protein
MMFRATSLFLCAAFAANLAAQSQQPSRVAQVMAGIEQGLSSLAKSAAATTPQVDTRDLANGALATYLTGGNPAQAENFLRMEFAQQNMDATSSSYGMVPWRLNDASINDDNAIEFGTEAIGPILLHYGSSISSSLRSFLIPHIQAAFVALKNHDVPVSYTNIFLMNTTNAILMAEAIGDATEAELGYAQLDQWIAYTKLNGVHEYDSPTYYEVDLTSLYMGYLYAAHAETRAEYKQILDLFWSDIAVNFFPGSQRLSGAHSRDYDFLFSTGDLDVCTYLEGLKSSESTSDLSVAMSYLAENGMNPNGYHPDASIMALAQIPTRIIRQTWNPAPNNDRYSYMTPDFVMGSATQNYDAQDKLVSIDLASPLNLPDITIVPDTFDAPYGIIKVVQSNGEDKQVHASLNPTIVQDHGSMLVLLDLDPNGQGSIGSFATNVILPSQAAEVTLDGKTVSTAAVFQTPAAVGSVVGLKAGNSAVAVRLFRADGAGGQQPNVVLKMDATGAKYNAARFVVYHYSGAAETLPDKHVRVGLLLFVGAVSSDADFTALVDAAKQAPIQDDGGTTNWNVSATVGGTTLAAGRNLSKRTIMYRTVNGQAVTAEHLSVNGSLIGSLSETGGPRGPMRRP